MIEINACDLYELRMTFPEKSISQLAIDLRLLYLVGVKTAEEDYRSLMADDSGRCNGHTEVPSGASIV